MENMRKGISPLIGTRAHSAPVLNSKKLKKGGKIVFVCLHLYGRFLSTKIMTTPMIATKTNRPAIAGTKY